MVVIGQRHRSRRRNAVSRGQRDSAPARSPRHEHPTNRGNGDDRAGDVGDQSRLGRPRLLDVDVGDRAIGADGDDTDRPRVRRETIAAQYLTVLLVLDSHSNDLARSRLASSSSCLPKRVDRCGSCCIAHVRRVVVAEFGSVWSVGVPVSVGVAPGLVVVLVFPAVVACAGGAAVVGACRAVGCPGLGVVGLAAPGAKIASGPDTPSIPEQHCVTGPAGEQA